MNWTPDNNYNGNRSGWNDANQNGYRLDDAAIAEPVSRRPFSSRLFRAALVILLLTGIVALYFTIRLSESLPTHERGAKAWQHRSHP